MASDVLTKIKNAGSNRRRWRRFSQPCKLNAKAEVVVVNGAECEPLIRVDQQLMLVEIDKLIRGFGNCSGRDGCPRGIIAVRANIKAVAALRAIAKKDKLRVYILDDFYPAGDEQVTLYEATGRLVPQGGIQFQVGAVVTNVETLINITNAVDEDKPVTDTYITVNGHVPHPLTVKVPVSVSVQSWLWPVSKCR